MYNNVVLFLNAAGTVLSKSEMDLYKKLKKDKKKILILNKIDKADTIDDIIRYVKKKTDENIEML